MPCSVDAGRTAVTRPVQCRSVAPGFGSARAPTLGLSTLNSMAFELAVYASRCGLPRSRARLASGRWSGATGRAFHPQGSDERFLSASYISSPFPKPLGATRNPAVDVTDGRKHNAFPRVGGGDRHKCESRSRAENSLRKMGPFSTRLEIRVTSWEVGSTLERIVVLLSP